MWALERRDKRLAQRQLEERLAGKRKPKGEL
jgi:hypothetical protein